MLRTALWGARRRGRPALASNPHESARIGRELFVWALVSLCAWPATLHAADYKPAVDRDTLVVGLEKSISNLDAQVTSTGDSLLYAWQVYDTLYGFDAVGNLVPRMASAVQVSPDRMRYVFTLRKGIRFQNGDALTGADVKYSLERILEPATKSTRRVYFAPVVKSVEAGPDTVTIALKQPDGAFLNKVAGFLFIVPKDYTTKLGTPEAFAAAPIGSGPFRVKEFKVGQYLELERFDGYWGKEIGERPGVRRLLLRFVPEAASRVNALLNGEIDLATVIPLQDVTRLKADSGLEVITNPNGGPLHVRLYSNVPSHPFANRDVRQALNYAVDSEAIIKGVLHGVGSPMGSFISRFYPYGADPESKPYPYDPAKARELLKKAGFANGFDVKLYNGTDQPKELAEAVAAYWGQVGIKTELVRMDYSAFIRLNNTHKAGPATVTIFSNVIYDPIHPIVGTFSKDGTWSDYYNPDVEALINELEGTLGAEARGILFRKIGRILRDDAASINLSEHYYVYARKKDLQWQVQQGSGFLNFRRATWK
jgi:peptide/nickel transport system substrate-binding protein